MLARIKGRAKAAVERRRLARVRLAPCEVERLARLSEADLRAAMEDPATAQDWPAVAETMRALGLPDGTGGVNPGDRRAIYHLVRRLRPRRVLEVGTHIGASTVHIARALADNGPDGTLVTVDIADVNDPHTQPWRRHGCSRSPAAMIGALGLTERVTFVCEPSVSFLAGEGEPFDFIFLDGDHAASTVARELPLALRRLAHGGTVLLHDYFPGLRPLWPGRGVIPGPYLATEALRAAGARFEVLALGALPWPTKAGTNVTSLGVVARA